MKKRIISILLSLTLIGTTFMTGTSAHAAEGDDSNKGMEISKTATANEDGTYTIQLEAYATGSKVITEEKKDIPTDIVLVLDQSGSMNDPISTVSFEAYKDESGWLGTTYHTRNRDYFNNRHNGGGANLYYPLENGAYASVSVTVQMGLTYTALADRTDNSAYYTNRNNLYARVNGEYQEVTIERTRNNGSYKYSYKLPDGSSIAISDGRNGVPDFNAIDGNVLYQASEDETQNVYTYTYTDANGETQTIGTSTGAETTFETTLYKRVINTNASKLNALKNAVKTFSDNVAEKAAGEDGEYGTADDINHRIAVVGYAYGSKGNGNDPAYTNTEVFIGNSQYGYGASAQSVYRTAFQDMNTEKGRSNITASINALDANGATYTDLGMEMANGILNVNPVPDGEQRNRVIIVFTDGQPGWSGYDSTVATDAINQGNIAKNTYKTTVYSVGIFSGADATSAGNSSGNDTEKANWFMQNVSSNNGTPQTPSYYLSAADADTLNNIFQQISDNIETGGASTTLSSETVIKDIISPAFALPEGATADDITLETYSCTGKDGDSYIWSRNGDAMGASAAVNDDQVSVTGFDFAENYVGTVTENGTTTYRGDKLVIKFKVSPKEGFLGGNDVCTNTSAGVFENSTATDPVLTFERPQVNVAIGDVMVTAEDKNVYLLNDLTADQLRSGTTVKVGDVELNLNPNANNYGLETWQNEYVDIRIAIKDQNGNEVTDLNDLREDGTYSVSVTVSPKTDGKNASGTPSAEKSSNDSAVINVYKPEVAFQDSEVYYGDTAPMNSDDYDKSNYMNSVWKYGESTADSEKMGAAPALTFDYSLDAAAFANGKIATKEDIPVKVTTKIGDTDVTEYTTYVHKTCDPACTFDPETEEFLLHVRTCELTITKKGGDAGEKFIFHIEKDGAAYTSVTVDAGQSVTIAKLPIGTYTVSEDASWAWRYTPAYENGQTAELSAEVPESTITCTNTKKNDKWLNWNGAMKNEYGKTNNGSAEGGNN